MNARPCVARARLLALPLLLVAACGDRGAPWPDAPRVALDLLASGAPQQVPLLGAFDLRLDLYHRADLEVDFDPPVPAGFTGTVELQPERPLGPGRWRRAVLHLRATKGPGKVTIPPFRAAAKDGTVGASTPELSLDVTSLLAGAGAEVEPPGPPLLPPRPLWPWFAGLGALALLALVVRRWRRRRRVRASPLAIAVPPHIKAMREIARLRAMARRTPAEVDAFYVATSAVLRGYFEERFGLRAPERTTEEFLQEVEAGGPLSTGQCLEVRRFLQQCDLVKFAAQMPAEEVHLQTLAIAEQIVAATRPDLAPVGVSA